MHGFIAAYNELTLPNALAPLLCLLLQAQEAINLQDLNESWELHFYGAPRLTVSSALASSRASSRVLCLHACLCRCTHTGHQHKCGCIFVTYAHMQPCTHATTHTCMHAHEHAHAHVCAHMHTHARTRTGLTRVRMDYQPTCLRRQQASTRSSQSPLTIGMLFPPLTPPHIT